MFFGDHRMTEDPREFLESLEDSFIGLPADSEAAKLRRFYRGCKSGADAEEWYDTLTKNSVITTWFELVAQFHIQWQYAFSREEILAHTSIPAPTNTAADAIHETVITPEQHDRAAAPHVTAMSTPAPAQIEVEQTLPPRHCHIPAQLETEPVNIATPTPAQAQLTVEPTTTATDTSTVGTTVVTTATNAIAEHRENESMEGAEGKEEQDVKSGWELQEEGVEAREVLDTGEQKGIGGNQSEVRAPALSYTARSALDATLHEPVRFDWAPEVDESSASTPFSPTPVVRPSIQYVPGPLSPYPLTLPSSTPSPMTWQSTPLRVAVASAVPTDPVPADPSPNDVTIDPVHVVSASAMQTPVHVDPASISMVNPIPVVHSPNSVSITRSISADSCSSVDPTQTVLVDPDPDPPVNSGSTTPIDLLINSIVPIDHDPGDAIAIGICVVLASTVVAVVASVDSGPIFAIHFACVVVALINSALINRVLDRERGRSHI
jgi:hypothetical protein